MLDQFDNRIDELKEMIEGEIGAAREDAGVLGSRISELRDELSSLESSLDSKISDERFDRERADTDLKNDVDSLRHDVQYGR